MIDGAPEPDVIIINHMSPNHYSSDGSSDTDEMDLPPVPPPVLENHMSVDPQVLPRTDEAQNGQPRADELPLGSEDREEVTLMGSEEPGPRFLSPEALKKHIHGETTKINNELRTLITKEIRKPGRCTCW